MIHEENERYQNLLTTKELDVIISKAQEYHEKLVNIKKSMVIVDDRVSRLRKRAVKLLDAKTKAEMERQRSKERQEILERHLEPVVNTERK